MDGNLILNAAQKAVGARLHTLGRSFDQDDINEMVSMTVEKFLTKGAYDPSKSSVQTYVSRIACNVVYDFVRANDKRKNRYSDIDTTNVADSLTDNWETDSPMLKEEQDQLIDKAVSRLNGRQQTLFKLLREEHSNKEIAEIMGTTASIVAVEACRMKHRMRALLQEAA